MKDELTKDQWLAEQDQEFKSIEYCDECGEDLPNGLSGSLGLSVCPHCGTIEGNTTTVYQCSLCLEEHEDEECNCYG